MNMCDAFMRNKLIRQADIKELLDYISRPPTRREFDEWYDGYWENNIMYFDNYDDFKKMFRFVYSDILPPFELYGENAVYLLIPKECTVIGKDYGHCDLVYIDRYIKSYHKGKLEFYKDNITLIDKYKT